MACPELNPKQPPLSYGIASFKPEDYNDPAALIAPLAKAGFKVLTLVPTFEAETQELNVTYELGHGRKRARKVVKITNKKTPSLDAIKALAIAGIKADMHVRFEPHIDPDVTLQGHGETYWRAQLVFEPDVVPPSYYNVVLDPLFEIIAEIRDTPIPNLPNCKPCFSLTLGSELDAALLAFPGKWLDILNRLKQKRAKYTDLEPRLIFGHKINWDFLTVKRQNEWCSLANAVDKELGSGPTNLDPNRNMPNVMAYLAKLDYIGVSFYPPLAGPNAGGIDPNKWKQKPTDASIGEMADLLEKQWQQFLGQIDNWGPSVEIGEAGIGTPDAADPWTVTNPARMKTPEGRNVAEHVVRGIALWAKRQADRFKNKSQSPCMAFMPITYWTVQQFDWLGLRPEWREYGIEALIEWVKRWNSGTFSAG